MVEPTFGGMIRWRRPAPDFERPAAASAAVVKLGAIHRRVRRAGPPRGRKEYRYKRPPEAAT